MELENVAQAAREIPVYTITEDGESNSNLTILLILVLSAILEWAL